MKMNEMAQTIEELRTAAETPTPSKPKLTLEQVRATERSSAAKNRLGNSAGYLSPETVFVDGTHIKANANLKKVVKKEIPRAAKIYEKQLMDEINEDREKHGKKAF